MGQNSLKSIFSTENAQNQSQRKPQSLQKSNGIKTQQIEKNWSENSSQSEDEESKNNMTHKTYQIYRKQRKTQKNQRKIQLLKILNQFGIKKNTPHYESILYYYSRQERFKYGLQKQKVLIRIKTLQIEQNNKVIRQTVIRSIFNFIVKYEKNIQIYVHENNLRIQICTGKVHIQDVDTMFYLTQNFMRVLSCYQPKAKKQVEKIFNGLFKCLKYFLMEHVQQRNVKDLDSIDFLCLPRLQQQTKSTTHKPIFMGNLRLVCMKFYRILVRMILEHKQILLTDISLNRPQVLQQCTQYIQTKINKLKSFEVLNQRERINTQLKSTLFREVVDNFNEQVDSITTKFLFDSIESFRINQKLSLLHNWNHQQTVNRMVEVSSNSLQLINQKYFGKFVPYVNNQVQPNTIQMIRKSKLFPFQQKFGLDELQAGQWDEVYLLGQNKRDNTKILFYSTGDFILLAKTEQNLDKYMKKLAQILQGYKVQQLSKQHAFEGQLGVTFQMKMLENIDWMRNNISGQFISEVEERVFKEQKRMQICRLMIEKDDRQKIQEAVRRRNNYEPFVHYHHKQWVYQGQTKKLKETLLFDLYQNGKVRVVGIKSKQCVLDILSKIRKEIEVLKSRQLVKDAQPEMVQESDQQYHTMKITGSHGKVNAYFQNLWALQSEDKSQDFALIKLKLQRGINDNLPPLQKTIERKKLKVLIWNICADLYEVKNLKKRNYEKSEQQVEAEKQFDKWKVQRLKHIVQTIKNCDADFILLQQSSAIYDPDYPYIIKGKLFQSLTEDLRKSGLYLSKVKTSSQQNIRQIKSFHRSIIISKIPVQFYEVGFKNQTAKFMTMCEFNINVNGVDYPALLASIHLKAWLGENDGRACREKHLRMLNQMSKQFKVSIFGGDYNIGENQKYPQNSMLTEQYIDLDSFYVSEQSRITCVHHQNPPQRFDRILMKVNDEKLNLFARPKQIGNFSALPYQDQFYRLSEKDGKQRGLSDHYGRCTQIIFLK